MTALRLLGPPSWQQPGGKVSALAPHRRHQLLALLGYEWQWVSRERLSALFWPERPDRAARSNLRKVIHELRALRVDDLEEGPQGLRWQPASDVASFRRACDAGDWQQAADTDAAELMQGLEGDLGGTAFGDWLRAERQHWRARWRQAALRAAASSDAQRAWRLAERLLALDAADEDAMALALRTAEALQRPDLAEAAWSRHVQRLQAELGASPSLALQALVRAPSRPRNAQLSPLIGRERELHDLGALLAERRLVTLLGPGGVGKSRLARHAADSLAARFAHGVVFVALDDARTPDELAPRAAAALGLDVAGGGDAQAALSRALAARSTLLVLDGFEAVIDAGPSLLRLLSAAPELRVLVTSRERLAVDGEWLLPLSGLAVPEAGASDEVVLGSQAVALFATRARAVNPAFDLATALVPVAEICRRLDGLPLALELAASWVRVLPAAEIAGELAQGVGLLDQGGEVDLHAVFDRSWSLLAAGEREAQARLAVFRGGFTREAALRVAGVELRTLAALADKSMLSARAGGRFDMHPLLLAHARRKLAERNDAAQVQEAHSRWFLGLAAQPDSELAAEHDNLLAAWQAAVARRDAAALESVLFRLPWPSLVRGQMAQAVQLLHDAAQAFGTGQPAGAQLLALQAWLLLWQGQRRRAVALAEAALQTLQGGDQVAGAVMALRTLGHAARLNGQHAQSAAHLADGAERARAAGLVAVQALMLDGLAMALNMLGRHDEARVAVHSSMALNVSAGDATQRLYNLYNLSQSHSLAGEPAQALPWAGQALALAQRIGFAYFLPHIHVELALIQLGLQHVDEARRHLAAAGPPAIDHQDFTAQAAVHEAAARVALAAGDAMAAGREISAVARLCLERDNVVTSAALVLTAARLHQGTAAALRWLEALIALPAVQEPVRRQAASARGDVGLPTPTHGPLPGLRQLLTEVISADGSS